MLLAQNENRLMQQFGVRHELLIHEAGKEDFGNYSCSAENKLGRSRAFIEVSGKYVLCIFLVSSILCESVWKIALSYAGLYSMGNTCR